MADFYFIYFLFFYYFSKKLFYFRDNWKSYSRLERKVTIPFQKYQQVWASLTNGGPGGAPKPPPASKCHKKNVGEGGSHHTLTDCVDWAYLSVVGVRTKTPPRVGNHTKKTKVPTLPQKSQKTKVVGKKWKSRHRLFKKSATRKK